MLTFLEEHLNDFLAFILTLIELVLLNAFTPTFVINDLCNQDVVHKY